MPEKTDIVKEAAGLVKAASDLFAASKGSETVKSTSHRGPLQVLGRLYLGLTGVLAVFVSTAAYLDVGRDSSPAVACLRYLFGFVVLLGIVGTSWASLALFKKHPSWLSSPGEFSPEAQRQMMSMGPKEANPHKGDDEEKLQVASSGEPEVDE